MQSTEDHKIIGTGEIEIGRQTSTNDASFVFLKAGKIKIGDYCNIGPGCRFIISGGTVEIGDWTTIHNNTLVLCENGVTIGQHCWFGQNSVIDGTGGLYIGNGVRVGMYSQLWTHAAAGERIEGCTLFTAESTYIEDDVWLVGSCICSSGIRIGRKTVALIGSNITKSFPENSVLAGIPAQQKTGISFYKPLKLVEKWELLVEWLYEYVALEKLPLVMLEKTGCQIVRQTADAIETIAFFQDTVSADLFGTMHYEATICCLETKSYVKRYTALEQQVLKHLASNKARFYSRTTQ